MLMVELIGHQLKAGFDYLFNIQGENGVISSSHSKIDDNFHSHLLVTPSWDILPGEIELTEGLCKLLAVINISDSEQEFAELNGIDSLVEQLKIKAIPPIIDPNRESIL